MMNTAMNTFSNVERKLAQYILIEPQKIIDMSIQELALNSGVSEATIIRFSRKLGFNGYSELKIILATELITLGDVDVYEDIKPSDDPLDIFKKLTSITIQTLNDTINIIDKNEINKAIELVEKARIEKRCIYIIGSGGSSVITKDLQYKLMRIGILAQRYENSHIMLESIINCNENDLVIVFSALGKSKDIFDCMDIAKRNKARIVLITQFGNKNFIDLAEVKLLTANVENNLRLGSMASRLVQLQIVDMIFVSLALKRYRNIRGNLNVVKELFKEKNYYL